MYYTLQCLVLRTSVSAEADKAVTLYTRQWGKITSVVPGAKKIKAKLSYAAEPVMENEFMVYAASPAARSKVTGVRALNSFAVLRRDWRRFCIAQHCGEIVEMLTPFNAENTQKYDLLARTWQLLETARRPWRILAAFSLRFLKLSGYSFTEYIKSEDTFISQAEQAVIRQLATLSGDEIDSRINVDPAMEKDIMRHLDAYLQRYVSRPLSAKKFWHAIDAMP